MTGHIDWSPYERDIISHYVTQNHTAEETIQYAEERWGLQVTYNQFSTKFGGLKKIRAVEWSDGILPALRKRALHGKESNVYLHGRQLESKRLRRGEDLYSGGLYHDLAAVNTSQYIGRTLSDRLCITTPPAQQPSLETRGFQTEASRHLLDQQHLRSNEGAAASLGQPTPLGLPHADQFDSQFDIYDTVEDITMQTNSLQSMPLDTLTSGEFSVTFDEIFDSLSRNPSPSVQRIYDQQRWSMLENLPWLRLRDRILQSLINMNPLLQSPPIPAPMTRGNRTFDTPYSPPRTETTRSSFHQTIAKFVGCVQSTSVQSTTTTDLAPSLAHKLQEFIPELYSGDLKQQIQAILQPDRKLALQQVFELAAYLFSNNQLNGHQTYAFIEWIINDTLIPVLKQFLGLEMPSTKAFRSGLLSAGVRAKKPDFVRQVYTKECSFGDIAEEAMAIPDPDFQTFVLSTLESQSLSGENGGRLLRIVARTGNVNAAATLVAKNATATTRLSADVDTTALWEAVANQHLEMVECLAKAGADVNALSVRRWPGKTALEVAVYYKNLAIAECLIKYGARVPAQHGDTPFLGYVAGHASDIHTMILERVPGLSKTEKDRLSAKDIVSAAQYTPDTFSAFLRERTNIPPRLLEQALVEALRAYNTNSVVNLLQQKVDPDGSHLPPGAYVPIAVAIGLPRKSRRHYINLLIDAGVSVNVPDLWHPLLYDEGLPCDADLLDSVISAGYDLTRHGPQLVERLIEEENLAFTMLLLDRGAPVNDYGRRYTALQAASFYSTLHLVHHLVSIDADVNKPAYPVKGMTALQCSAHGEVDTLGKIEYLLSKGANVNDPPAFTGGMTALEATVRPLLSLYDDDEAEEDYYGRKPQIIEAFSLLLRSGAAVNRVDGSPSPLLHDIIMRNEPEVLKLALEKGADRHHMWGTVYHDRTPLQLAAELGQLKSVELLLQHRTDPNALPASNHGRTALQAAASSESPDINIITLLLSNGAKVNAPPAPAGGITALQGAAIKGYINIALLLIKELADVNAPPSPVDGRTAIDGAAEHGRLDMVQVLLNAGAVGDVLGKSGFANAIELARRNKHRTVAVLLEEAEMNRRAERG